MIDLANPISNHIYQKLGYQPVRDVEEIRFV
jgi:predicted GNAT family acetyltransferase